MAITRRQSRKLPPPPAVGADADSDSSLTELESADDIESEKAGDPDGGPSSRARGKPPAKRAKKGTGAAAKAPQRIVRKRTAKLSQLPSMPLDVLYEVFGHVGPADLLSLSRASKALRHILMSRKSIGLWKGAVKNAGAPECPADLSEPAWAHLIFGGSRCQSCGTKGVIKVDFYLKRRLCAWCKKRELINSVKFEKQCPDFDPTIMELVPYTITITGGWAHDYISESKSFLRDDIYEMSQMLGAYQSDVHMHKPGAEKALEDFKAARMERVAAIATSARELENWFDRADYERLNAARQAKQERKDAIIARFVELGYHHDDAKHAVDREEGRSDRPLTEKIWTRIRQQLEPVVEEFKAYRQVRERGHLIRARQASLRALYKDFKKTLLPSQWANLPSDTDFLQFAECHDLVNLETNDPLSESDLAGFMGKLPALTSSWIARRKNEISRNIPGSASNTGSAGPSSAIDVDGAVDLDLLEAATSVFVCGTEGCIVRALIFSHHGKEPLVGLNHALSHVCDRSRFNTFYYSGGQSQLMDLSYTSQVTFSDRGSAAMKSLLGTLGLDAKRATRADLDREDPRLVCMVCKPKPMSGGSGRPAWSWIECVSHFITEKSHELPRWQLLTPEQTQHAKQQEGLDQLLGSREIWTCNHCSTYFENLKTKLQVTDHVKQVHGIVSPSEGTDLFIGPKARCPAVQRTMVLMEVTPPRAPLPPKYSNYICKQCPASSTRRFGEQGIVAHLRDKHKVTEPGPEHFGR
ncbi:hypothetical protein BOTBODRAFT_173854 [Botryobasidium botryosum FD-172 SS1]|uniref:F-box domain-containing protein n=1 Tax=Botryobasidium botryosum (strain FD-172 SS1) TaxID=930990 RepID=A0A067MKY5_BOTB1|nr:hypothetical protein BOTBODRAFT_173854 [Botryobasidium botryosum FD-172 SS1]